jgi:cyclopropane-fatty-acyl-phospholipid synthase
MTSKLLTSLRVKTLRKIFEQLQLGELQVTFPSGDRATYKGKQNGPAADITLSSPLGVKKMLQNGRIGFCEAYMAGEIESNNLASLIELGSLHSELLSKDLNHSPL